MRIQVEDATFAVHGAGCVKCRKADFPDQLCRNGRRIFYKWVGGMDADRRAIFLLGLPEDIREKIIKRFPAQMEGFQIFDFPDKPTN